MTAAPCDVSWTGPRTPGGVGPPATRPRWPSPAPSRGRETGCRSRGQAAGPAARIRSRRRAAPRSRGTAGPGSSTQRCSPGAASCSSSANSTPTMRSTRTPTRRAAHAGSSKTPATCPSPTRASMDRSPSRCWSIAIVLRNVLRRSDGCVPMGRVSAGPASPTAPVSEISSRTIIRLVDDAPSPRRTRRISGFAPRTPARMRTPGRRCLDRSRTVLGRTSVDRRSARSSVPPARSRAAMPTRPEANVLASSRSASAVPRFVGAGVGAAARRPRVAVDVRSRVAWDCPRSSPPRRRSGGDRSERTTKPVAA